MKKTIYLIWVLGGLMLSLSSTFAQSNRHWDFAPDGFNIPQGQLMQAKLPKEYKLARLNVPALYQELSDAYRAPADAPPLLISIPNPEGGYSEFFISPTSVVADEVAHLYTVRTFKGYAKNSRQVTLRCGISPTGFHAAVFSGDVMYVIESASRSDVNTHIVYYKSDLEVPGFRCGVDDTHRRSGYKPSESGTPKTPANLRTYRLAIIADATFRTQFGGMPYMATNVLNSMASGINMVNAVYERDLGVRFTLVSNAACADAVLTDHTDINAVHAFIVNSSGLGSSGFDVGHSLLWLNTGGVAYLGVVCNNSYKGGGFSGANGSVTQLYVDYMAHELGHQFGADHTFASSECGTSTNNFRYETGEGSTIMAYAGVCGAAPSYQNFSDPFFHAASIAQINTYIASGGTCAAISTPGTGNNAAPMVNALSDITIPKQTAFILVGSGSDANSDPITFSWEQYDGGGAATTGSPLCTSADQPLFRFRTPVADNFRIFPPMSNVLAGNNNTPAWEKLPCAARTLNFRLTARDNNTNWGRTASDNMVVTVADTGPFNVTAPNGGESWATSSTQNVTWTVNGTDAHCANVDVLISTDNGITYSVLGTFPNNGSASVTMPSTASTTARVLVQCSVGGNFRSASTFFDVSNAVFSIIQPAMFGAGNIVLLQADGNSSNNTTARIIEVNTSSASQTAISNIPIDGTGTNAMRFSGSATSTGYLSNSNDRSLLLFTGHNNTNTGSNANTLNPRAVGTLNVSQTFNLATTYTGTSGNQTRSATTLNNTNFFIADQGGIYTNSSTSASPSGNLRGIKAFGGTVYVGQTSSTSTVIQVSTVSAPSGGTITGLPGLMNNASFQDFYLIQSGSNGSTFDVLYVVTSTSATAGTIAKYSLVSGTWAANGTYTTAFGGFGLAAQKSGTGAELYVSSGNGATSANNVIKLTDVAGYNATISINTPSNVILYTAPTGTTVKGVAFAPQPACPVLTSTPGEVQITNSTCVANCTVTGGNISAPTMGCPTGSSIQYNVNGGGWSATLPTYATTGPAQTIQTRCLCDTDANTVSPTSTGVTTAPGNCDTPDAPAGSLAITNSTCTACAVSGGSIALGTVNGTDGTLQYSTDGGQNWSATIPTYNQTGPAQTIIASVLSSNGCRSNTTQVGVTVPGTCVTPDAPTGSLAITNSTCTACVVSGGSIALGTVNGTDGTLQYSTDGGQNWSATIPTYNQTGPAQTIIASVLSSNGCRSNTTQVGVTVPGTCAAPDAPTGSLAITNSTCTACAVSGGSIALGTVNGTGGTLEYSTDGGQNWSAILPTYNQTGPAQTILASVVDGGGCRSNSTQVGVTVPGTCTPPTAAVISGTGFFCLEGNTGNAPVTVTITGGTGPFTMVVNDGVNDFNVNNYNSGSNINRAVYGTSTYTLVSVTDANGCSVPSGSLSGTATMTQSPDDIEITGMVVQPTCAMPNGGSITLMITGGLTPYTFEWSNNEPDQNLTNIGPGDYEVTVTDRGGCESVEMFTLDPPVGCCPVLTSAPGEVQITNSTCGTDCTVSGGQIQAPTTGCPTGSSLQYSVNSGAWSATLPTYAPTGPAQTIQTRCSCDTDANTVSPASTGVTTVPGTCVTPDAPTGSLAITNSTCTACAVSGGSIALGTVNGTGGTLQYSTDGGQNWSATLPTYNQTGPAQTIIASVLGANGCRSNSTQVGVTVPGTCAAPDAPTGTLAITNSTCTACAVSGGSIALGTVNGTGGTLQYSTDGGQNWSATLPTYNQTGPEQTIIASVLGANGCRSNSTQVGVTVPGTCAAPDAPTGSLAITNSTCTACAVSGGSIALGSVSGTGGTLQYSTDGGQNWSATLPTYNQTGPAQTIIASVLGANGCRSNTTQVGATEPGECVIPLSPTGTLAITNNICTGCTASGGSIAIGTVSGTGGTLEFSTDGGLSWSTTLPTYNQNGPAQTIFASILSANGCRVSRQVGVTAPVVCSQPLSLTCVNSTVNFNGQSSITLTPAALVQIVGGCQIQSITASPATIACTQVGQTVPVTITVTDLGGITSTCTSYITVNGLPCNWQSGNVNCDEDNSVAFNATTGQWTVISTDCYYTSPFTADELVYARRQLCGNGSITVLVTNINPLAGGWAGVVMRETTDAGAKKAQLITNLSSLHRREFRTATNGQATPQQFQSNGRYWLRIVRTGNQFTMYTSANGISWFVAGSQNIVMQSCIQVGLVATNYTANGTVTTTFSNVGFTQDNPISGQAADVQPVLGQVEFAVFPNPTSGELNLDLTQYTGKPVRIELFSLEGKLMKFVEIDEVQTIIEQLDLTAFQNGMYLVKVKSDGLPDATKRVAVTR